MAILKPTVTIGGAPAGYEAVVQQPTVTIGGAPAGYQEVMYQPTTTIGGAPAGYQQVAFPTAVPAPTIFEQQIARNTLNTQNLTNLEQGLLAKSGLTESQLRGETAADRALAEQARRDLQKATLGLGTGGAPAGGTKTPLKTEAQIAAETAAAERMANRQSAYDLLYSQFKQYGLESLVEPLKGLIISGSSPAEFTIKLRETDAYKKRFAGNAARIQKGLRALDEAEYIALEDQYQNVMRNYGLPASYYAKDAMGTQQGFTNLIAGNVSAAELENRVQQATDIIDKGPKEYMDAIKQFYPDIQRGDLLAYVLDPDKALTKIQATLGAAKIGGEYLRAGLTADAKRAEELQRQGVTAEAARQGAQAIQSIAPRGSMLADIYQTGPYGQAQVEEEIYGLGGAASAKKRREQLAALEAAQFSGSAGTAQGALGRERAMGQGQF